MVTAGNGLMQGRPEMSKEGSLLRILVCEDDPFTLTILNKRLKSGGYLVETATNGVEGLEKIETFNPNLILSDWMMPEMDGIELCSALRTRPEWNDIYFILLTARDKNDDKVSALDTGADEYLVKPVDGRELMARLRAVERMLRLRNELSEKNRELNKAYKRINSEMQATSQIQRSLLPGSLPEIPNYHFAAHYQPSTECSGDFYDVLPLDSNRIGLVMGDVSGHGAPAMVAMAMSHILLHIETENCFDPAQVLYNINNKMFHYLPTGQYATMFYGILELDSGRLTYSSAGHPPPLCYDQPNGQATYLPGCEGFPIKLVGPDMDYENSQMVLAPGQHLILYTDGLIEAFNPLSKPYGLEGFKSDVIQSGQPLPDAILQEILFSLDAYREDVPMEDDLSLLIANRI